MTDEQREPERDEPTPVDPGVLQEALGSALGAFEMVLVFRGRTDLDYFDRIEAMEQALDALSDRMDSALSPKTH